MASVKVGSDPAQDTSPTQQSEDRSALPSTAQDLHEVREKYAAVRNGTAKPEEVEPPGTQLHSPDEPQRLLDLYLKGRLSQGELDYKLRVYNSVVAESIIKDTKHNVTRVNTYMEVPDAGRVKAHNPNNPDGKSGLTGKAPKGMAAGSSGDQDEQRKIKEQQKKEQKEEQKQQNVVQANLFERTNQAVKNAHHWREIHRQEELEREKGNPNSLAEGDGRLEKLQRTSKGTTEKLRSRQLLTKSIRSARKGEHASKQSTAVQADRNTARFWLPPELLDEIEATGHTVVGILRKGAEYIIILEGSGEADLQFVYLNTTEVNTTIIAEVEDFEVDPITGEYDFTLSVEDILHRLLVDIAGKGALWNGEEADFGLVS